MDTDYILTALNVIANNLDKCTKRSLYFSNDFIRNGFAITYKNGNIRFSFAMVASENTMFISHPVILRKIMQQEYNRIELLIDDRNEYRLYPDLEGYVKLTNTTSEEQLFQLQTASDDLNEIFICNSDFTKIINHFWDLLYER